MIQRPQTLFLALVILMMCLSLAADNWQKSNREGTSTAVQNAFSLTINTTQNGQLTTENKPRYYLAAALILVAGLAAWSMASFKNRLLQMKIGFGISLAIASALVAMMMGSKEGEQLLIQPYLVYIKQAFMRRLLRFLPTSLPTD